MDSSFLFYLYTHRCYLPGIVQYCSSRYIMRGLSRKELEALSSEVDNRCNDNILIEGCLKK